MTQNARPCEICGELLTEERMEAQPGTRLCPRHAEQIRKLGGEFRVKLTESSLAKPGSMKGNRGDVAVTGKERNHAALERLRQEYEREKENSRVTGN
jgi:hypothetical protein